MAEEQAKYALNSPNGWVPGEKTQRTIGKEKDKRISEYRRAVSRQASVANKRIERLEKNALTDSPAYKKFIDEGGHRFSVKGKSYNEVQQELSRINRFLNSETSTVKGVNRVLADMAANTGLKYSNFKELRTKAGKFFELSSKVEQYLRTVDDMASAIGYQKIWEAINQYTKAQEVDLSDSETDIDGMIEAVTNALKEFDDPIPDSVNGTGERLNWYKLKD